MTKDMRYNRCGRSGLLLPAISLGLWHSFGQGDARDTKHDMCLKAFDLGITHFDLANNYGPPPGTAEEAFGEILRTDLKGRRDEMIISTKAGYHMWDGPYGDGGSRKYLIASLDQSLKRMGLDYVDIFYHHRLDPDTPLEESMMALDFAVRSGRALYAGISTYPASKLREAQKILRSLGTPCIINQPRLNMLQREPLTEGVVKAASDEGMGVIAFSPLAQGVLTDRYLNGVPNDSRATHGRWFDKSMIGENEVARLKKLNELATARGQTLAQLALTWNLSHAGVTSNIIGASKVSQIEDCAKAGDQKLLEPAELQAIDHIMFK
jgi:L-glyceraldehyde 3-phosphate reductase